VDQPKLPKIGEIKAFDSLVLDSVMVRDVSSRLYSVLCILVYLLKVISPNSSWRDRLRDMIDQFPIIPRLSISEMGFPNDWKSHDFWQ
jgi:abortive infection bacteriophage resistance protein